MAKIITKEEMQGHNDATSLWMAIHDKVYDITKFVEEHPGGEEVLLQQGGQYSTAQFEDVGHSPDARDLMKQYEIGELAEDSKENKSTGKTPAASEGDNTWSSWLVPLGIAIAAALVYRFIISPSSN